MKKFWKYFFTCLLINFGGLALGAAWTDPGTISDWYVNLNQAPWTPPGWVFGAAWTTIGLTFSIWGGLVFSKRVYEAELRVLYGLSVVLNVIWNPLFFYLHATIVAGIVIAILGFVIFMITDITRNGYGWKYAIFSVPYFLWLMIATSLNWYIVIMN